MSYSKLHLGTGGIPLTTHKPNLTNGIKRIAELGLSCMEIEWGYGVRAQEKTLQEVKKVAEELNVQLTAHGPYYINLASFEEIKRKASIKRILSTARAAKVCGAQSITFHAAFYQGQDKNTVYKTVKAQLTDIVNTLREEDNNVWIRPELTGKESQFGDLDELIGLSQEVEGVLPCIDFSHHFTRYIGRENSYEAFCTVLEKLKKGLGKEILSNMHMHVSGIEYGPKGERRHLTFKESEFNYQDLLRALKDYDVKGILVCESPILEHDALLLKEAVRQLGS